MERVKSFFRKQNIYDEQFFEYIKTRVYVFPHDTSLDWFGCFPILEGDIIIDLRVVVPEIVTEKNLLVNLHEFYHAYELYSELGNVYVENKEQRENNAVNFERKYVTNHMTNNT